jgi:hypothetical protein
MQTSKLSLKGLVEISGMLGIIGSLIFVALEIRQNTNALRSATIQAIAELSYDSTMRLVDNSELREARRASRSDSLNDDQRMQLDSFYSALMRIHQIRLVQANLGVLNMNDAMQIGGRAGSYREAYFADYWARRRDNYPPEFQEYIEDFVLPLSPK